MKYDIIAKSIAINHAGNTLLVLYPIPNSRNEPSLLYMRGVLLTTIAAYEAINITIAREVIC